MHHSGNESQTLGPAW